MVAAGADRREFSHELASYATGTDDTMDTSWILSRKQLLLRDGLSFLLLTVTTFVLFGFTLFLFRSFTTHRADLSERWAGRGRAALQSGKADEAVSALETSLEYAPGDRANQLMLAQALSAAGRTEQATSYFLNLWETQPGDGMINLQLARLERRRGDKQAALRYYRAAIYGNWEGDGVVHRRDVRLELANYLIEVGDLQTAQLELLIAASNAQADPTLELGFGDELLRTGDRTDAMRYYRKVIRQQPRNAVALDKAGRLAFAMGDFARAQGWLERAVRDSAGAPGSAAAGAEDAPSMLHRTERLLAVSPDAAPNQRDRITRLMGDAGLAQARLSACTTELQATEALPPALVALATQWSGSKTTLTKKALMADEVQRDVLTGLIYDTETVAAQFCGQPTGDDALLLLLAESPHRQYPGSSAGQEP